MSESITTTTTAVSEYAGMTHSDLADAIRKESTKARTKTNEAFDCMVRMGHMLIELKARTKHGNFMDSAEHSTGLPQRSINRYMAIARDPDGFRNRRRGIPAEEVLTLTKKAPKWWERPGQETKVDTVSNLPPPSKRLPQITVDAEIVEPAAPPTAPAQAPLETPVEIEVETKVEEPPAPLVAAPTASPAPSLIEASESTLTEILELLPRLKPEEIAELHRVLESRWMNRPVPAPIDHLAACWKSATPEDRAAFLETAHLIEKP